MDEIPKLEENKKYGPKFKKWTKIQKVFKMQKIEQNRPFWAFFN